jgi:hypothetical protein
MNHTCKIKRDDDVERDEIFQRLMILEEKNKIIENSTKEIMLLKRENKKLKNEVKLIKKCVTNINTKNTNKGIINNGTMINNNITLVAYGSEDMSKLDKNEILRILKQGYNSTVKLTETIHFNPKYPEFHNIYITNMKDKYAMMYDGVNWTLTMKVELINRIYDDKKNYIEDNLEDFVESLTLSQKRALERWTNADEEDKKIRELKERIKLLLYNCRQLPINTQNTIDNSNVRAYVQ